MSHQLEVPIGLAVAAVGCLLADTAAAQISDEPDAVIEKCLSEGRVAQREGRLEGVTNPERYRIECDGRQRSAVFKSWDEHRLGRTRLPDGRTELNFSDSFRYEVAAYLLDRQLGMNMVPVAVLRQVRGHDGCLVDWIPNAANEKQWRADPTGPQLAHLAEQKAVMRLFDALIYNIDRRPENCMIDHDTFKLYLIDHSRAFRQDKQLPESFRRRRARLTSALHEQLKRLSYEELAATLGDLITDRQLEALLERRDRILEKIDKERQEYGDQIIFFDRQSTGAGPEEGRARPRRAPVRATSGSPPPHSPKPWPPRSDRH